MLWFCPIAYRLIPTDQSDSYLDIPDGYTGLPLPGHPGAFGFERKNHIHEGVDLYVPWGTPVYAVEPGEVVAIVPFTGEHAGSPWWNDTWAVMVEGRSGVVCYGEIDPLNSLKVGQKLDSSCLIGNVKTVLKKNKGRPMSMLHLELYEHGVREPVEWKPGEEQPQGLRDPTPHLIRNTNGLG